MTKSPSATQPPEGPEPAAEPASEPASEPAAEPAAEPASHRRTPPHWGSLVICVAVVAATAAGAALHWLQPVLIPFILALLLTAALQPVAKLLVIYGRLPRVAAVLGALLLGGVVVALVGTVISGSVKELAAGAEAYEARAQAMGLKAIEWAAAHGIDAGEGVRSGLRSLPIGKLLSHATGALINLLSNSFLVLLFTVYLLLDYDPHRASPRGLRGAIESRVRKYIVVKIALSSLTGGLVGVILWALGIELAAVFGLLAFLLNFVPNVGSIVATLLPLPIVLFSPDASHLVMILAIALPGVVQLLVGNVLEPKLLGESLELHAITILLGLMLWGMVWGLPGMVLATPLMAVMKILFEHLEPTRPLARLMAGSRTTRP